jgi:hypothetical protein
MCHLIQERLHVKTLRYIFLKVVLFEIKLYDILIHVPISSIKHE